IEAGKPFPLEIEMHFTSWVFPKGHRIRLSVSNAQWPTLLPTPDLPTTSLFLGPDGTRLRLPVVPAGPSGTTPPAPGYLPIPPKAPPLPGYEEVQMDTPSAYGEVSSIDRNPRTGRATVIPTNNSAHRFPWGEERYSEK